MVKKKKFNISNRVLYTLIAIGILVVLGVGVYGLTAGVAPNPGHLITEVAPPAGCTSGQFLEFSGGTWTCANPSSGGGSSQWTTSGSNIYYSSGNVGVGTSSPAYPLDVNGNVNAQAYYVNGVPLSTTGNGGGSSSQQPLATTDSNGNWVWTSVGGISHSVQSGNGLSQVYTDTIQLDSNRPILGIKISGHGDDLGFCAAGVNGYFWGAQIRGGVLTGIDSNGIIKTPLWNIASSQAGDLNSPLDELVFSHLQSGPDLGGQQASYTCGLQGTCPNNNVGWNKAEGLVYIPEGKTLNVQSQFYNNGGAGLITCNIQVLYASYSISPPGAQTQCTNAHGTWINNVCRFDGASCPVNWVNAGSGYTATQANTCTGAPDPNLLCSGSNTCTTPSHSWDYQAIETCEYNQYCDNPSDDIGIPSIGTCTATVSQVGCLPA